jgi:putative acetyltransferase
MPSRSGAAAEGYDVLEAAPAQLDAVRALFREYADWLQAEICLQGFERELAELPGAYAPPLGRLLLAVASSSGAAVGCVGVRPLDGGACEMKRLYLRPQSRGHGLGRRLVAAALDGARQAGHRRMVLETLPRMTEARRLYESLGFRVRCRDDLPAEIIFCELELRQPVKAS